MRATQTDPRRPITPSRKVGDVLKEYPQLLEVFVAQSPHFERLRNPILRRLHGSLVSVGQAAAIAGIDQATLVRTLNTAVGLETVEEAMSAGLPTSMKGLPEPPWLKAATIAVELDVREDQRQGSDPFHRIMAAVGEVNLGEVFYLRNTFEPLPLYDVLGKRGFSAWARQRGAEDWEMYFLKVAEPAAAPAPDAPAVADEDWEQQTPAATVTVDVRDLTPPQPMLRILDALAGLKQGEVLLVHHKRRPVYLYPKLMELGCTQKTIEIGPDQVDVYIRKG